ncbi:hypothetical protein DCC81_23415 [Chitinophaga parva]|uniref:DUF998 domain-containing protein n=1 Tax=Chitinophaga parva TaxID=2169414 RepID=A0A2T7BE32_9BACT|nr:DUF998 domain-containing protein [Chitinophaga parva]PUZ23337.1 hypothetical protein DCC81_23415 [Chitinophaga parva]
MSTPISFTTNGTPVAAMNAHPRWPRITVLSVLGYEAAGCLAGGVMLMAVPDGSLMDMPVTIMHGSFPDFTIPGLLLFCLGVLNTVAFYTVFTRKSNDWIMAGVALGGMVTWFWIEIAILLKLHWLHLMWGVPVLVGLLANAWQLPSREVLRRLLLTCGIAASLLYATIIAIVAAREPTYDLAGQTISELSAIGAPTRTLWIILCTPYTWLMLAFAMGVWYSGRQYRPLRMVGLLLGAYAVLGLLWPLAPMHQRDMLATTGGSFSDTAHIVLGAVTQIIFLLSLGLSAQAFGKGFRVYAIITLIFVIAFGLLTFIAAPGIARGTPTPLIGVWECINIGVFLLWVIVLALRTIRYNGPGTGNA